MTYHERPGVYTDYDLSAVYASTAGAKTVAIAAESQADAGCYTITRSAEAEEAFGNISVLTLMVQTALAAGATKVLAYPVWEDYTQALESLAQQKQASIFLVDSADLAVQQTLQATVESASEEGNECIGLVAMGQATTEERIARAKALNSPRMVLVGPQVYAKSYGSIVSGYLAVAALAGVIAGQTDPALPLNGAVLPGLSGVDQVWSEQEIDQLILGGVTPLEYVGGQVQVIRAVTTCTSVNGTADATWRELGTVLCIDEVIPGVRAALRKKFTRAKNNPVTRNAIRSQVVVELENYLHREIIDSYSELTVEASLSDPSVCAVRFAFTVTRGLSRILLTAHITL